jgi:hypothetical protein
MSNKRAQQNISKGILHTEEEGIDNHENMRKKTHQMSNKQMQNRKESKKLQKQ